MIKLQGYNIHEKIHENQIASIYRANRENDDKKVVIKMLNSEYPTLKSVEKLKREFDIVDKLNVEGVIDVYKIENYQNSPAIIFEDFGGVSLKKYEVDLSENIELFLTIALQIASSLGDIHEENIIHKDLKPTNILINQDTNQVKIIDFGISSQLGTENQSAINPLILEGTLEYMSPEQTGRMNRTLDYRSDYYSLGVTFYELLCNKLPFKSEDPMEVVHGHIARQPISPKEVNSNIPRTLSKIILKLLSKTSEERYQSSNGIYADLEKCLNSLKKGEEIADFELGLLDRHDKLNFQEKLYGREIETQILLEAYDRSSEGNAEFVLVGGFSGIGKSVLVNDIHKPIVQNRGYFISGKFDQFNKNIPYSSITQAFSELINQLLTETDEAINQWRNKIQNALGLNGQVIVDLIPEMELIIGKQAELTPLESAESQNRLIITFQSLVNVFSKEEHPLALILDDLQWADSGSLYLIQSILSNPENKFILIVGTYRNNEVDATHPLTLSIDELESRGINICKLNLKPLAKASVMELVNDTFNSNDSNTTPLTDQLMLKTNGNPFFISIFLKKLYSEKSILFDAGSHEWCWDIEEIKKMNITDNVVELLSNNIQNLSESTQNLIKFASCIGNKFELKIISKLSGQSYSDTASELFIAMEKGFITPIGNDYKLLSSVQENDERLGKEFKSVNYKFVHDRVQQAAYTLMDAEKKKSAHLSIGRLMIKSLNHKELDGKLFDVVSHLNFAQDLLEDEKEKLKLAEMNLEVGIRAKNSGAYSSALKYISSGMDLLSETNWSTSYGLSFSLSLERAQCEYLNGNHEKAEEHFDNSYNHANSKNDKVRVFEKKIHFYTNTSQFEKSYETARQALKLFKINLPSPKLAKPMLISAFIKSKVLLRGRKIESLAELPAAQNNDKKSAIKLISAVLKSAYQIAPELCIANATKIVNLTMKHGMTEDTAVAYIAYGGIFQGGVLGNHNVGYDYGQLALTLQNKHENIIQKAELNFVYAYFCNSWKHHIKETEFYYKEALKSALEIGDFFHGGCAITAMSEGYLIQGKPLDEIIAETEKYLELSERIHNVEAQYTIKGIHQAVLCLQGKTENSRSYQTKGFVEDEYVNVIKEFGSQHFTHFYYINKMQTLYLIGSYSEALQYARKSEKFLEHSIGMVHMVEHYFYYSLILSAIILDKNHTDKTKFLSILKKNKKKLKSFAEDSPINYEHKYLLVSAEIANINKSKAAEYYNKALESAKGAGYIQNQAIINERAAKYYISNGNTKSAKPYLLDAHYNYSNWGANAKANQLKEDFPDYFSNPTSNIIRDEETLQTSSSSTSRINLDIQTIVKASQTISSEVVLETLLEKLMSIVIQNAGAQHGLFLLEKDGDFYIEAEDHIDQNSVKAFNSVKLQKNSLDAATHIINFVANTKENIVLANASTDTRFEKDPYIISQKPKSVLCSPILNQGKLIGIIYLENNLTTNVFTKDRIELLTLLSGQAGISIENAMMYQNLENKVQERTQEIESQKKDIERKHKEITDSIAYAKRIQSAILPPLRVVKEHLKNSFILYKPKDIVAGDFYWLEFKNDQLLFAVADCTGHGVPGAMVSVVCNNGLNRSVREYGLMDPGKILDRTREIVIEEFEKSDEDVKDGMDIALCTLDGNKLSYAGAHNPLWIIRNGEIIETKGNKQPIGKFEYQTPFDSHHFELEDGDAVYIFSDGYVDQFGGPRRKKFKPQALRELLLSIQGEKMEDQKSIIDKAFLDWQGEVEQIDDVCVWGFKFND